MSQAIIRAKFMTTLAAYAAAHNPVFTIAREGAPFTKPLNNATFLEAFLIPADTTLATLSASRRRFMGVFQINIWTKDSQGAGVGEAIAEELAQLFPVYPHTFDPVFVVSPPNISRALTEDGWRIIPVVVSYRMESIN